MELVSSRAKRSYTSQKKEFLEVSRIEIDHCLAQENAGGHLLSSLSCRAAREHGQPAAGVPGAESCHRHHDPPAQPRPVRGRGEQSEHPGGRREQPGQPVPHGPRLAPMALTAAAPHPECEGRLGP